MSILELYRNAHPNMAIMCMIVMRQGISSVAFLCKWQELSDLPDSDGSSNVSLLPVRHLGSRSVLPLATQSDLSSPPPHETLTAQPILQPNWRQRPPSDITPRKVEEVLVGHGNLFPEAVDLYELEAFWSDEMPDASPLQINKAINYPLFDATPGERQGIRSPTLHNIWVFRFIKHLECARPFAIYPGFNLSWVSRYFGAPASPRKDSEMASGRGCSNIAVMVHQFTSGSSVYH
ncbi:hypothetical protein EDB86DRAFT_2827419 [Lactarius hatsudake]|nr:hypothetical protein EDB86DRAFT_2827419 [Lactarius hatsudake]